MKFRFTTKDSYGSIFYLEVSSIGVHLMNTSMVSMCLSNLFSDGARLTFKLTDLYEAYADVSNRVLLGGISPEQTAALMRNALNAASAYKWEVLRL